MLQTSTGCTEGRQRQWHSRVTKAKHDTRPARVHNQPTPAIDTDHPPTRQIAVLPDMRFPYHYMQNNGEGPWLMHDNSEWA